MTSTEPMKPAGALYIGIASQLKNDIVRGAFPDNRLPTEEELSQRFGVSRNTIREALSMLEMDGLITRRQGVGTFIERDKVHVGSRTIGFTESMRLAGRNPGTLMMSFDWEPADQHMSGMLDMRVGEAMGVLKRVRSLDGVPAYYQIERLPAHVIGEDFDPDAMGESLFEYLNKQRDIEVGGSEFSLRATVPNRVIASILGMDIGLPLLMIEDLYRSREDKPLLWSVNYYRSDLYCFRAVERNGTFEMLTVQEERISHREEY
ncbi:MAG: GntR family transcriptional regulator [Bacillota bacterium]|jgi:GntR family transcriptional regulator